MHAGDVDSPETEAFVKQARLFCDFVEHAAAMPLAQRLLVARERLLELTLAATRLPIVDPPEGFDAGPSPAVPSGWAGFEAHDIYWEVFDPYVNEPAVAGSLDDDVLDVYGDLHTGLDLWDSTAPRAAAIWEWRFSFETHWGDHAVDAIRALQRAVRG